MASKEKENEMKKTAKNAAIKERLLQLAEKKRGDRADHSDNGQVWVIQLKNTIFLNGNVGKGQHRRVK